MNLSGLLPAIDTLGYSVLSFLLSYFWQSSIVLIAALGLTYLLRRSPAAFRHTILVAVLFAIPAVPLFTSIVSTVDAPRTSIPIIPEYEVRIAESIPSQIIQIEAPVVEAFTKSSIPGEQVSILHFPWAVSIIVFVFIVLSLSFMVLYGRLRIAWWLKNSRVITDKSVYNAFRKASKKLRLNKDFLLVETSNIESPFTSGSMRPVVFLPQGLSESLNVTELKLIALHELAHIKRRDPLILTLVSWVRCLCFFNPLIWVVADQISRLAEEACDDVVLNVTNNPLGYAKTLTSIAENLSKRRIQMELSAGILISKKVFFERIRAILSTRDRKSKSISKRQIFGSLLVILLSYGLAVSSPLIHMPGSNVIAANVQSPSEEDTGSDGAEDRDHPSEKVEIGMNPQQVIGILGQPGEKFGDEKDAKKIFVWKYKKLLFNTKTVIVVFKNDSVNMITRSSGNIRNPVKYVAKTEKEVNKDKAIQAKALPSMDIEHVWTNLSYILGQLMANESENASVSLEVISNFDNVMTGMSYQDVVAKLGNPADQSGNAYQWEYGNEIVTVDFKGGKVNSKKLQKDKLRIKIEDNSWNAKDGKIEITTIYD